MSMKTLTFVAQLVAASGFVTAAHGSSLALVIIDRTPVRSQPSEVAELAKGRAVYKHAPGASAPATVAMAAVTLSAGDRVEIVAESKDLRWRKVDLGYLNGWVPYESVATLEKFVKVSRWTGPRSIEVEAGDYAGSIRFLPNGEYLQDEDTPGRDRGHLYILGDVIWAVGKKSQEFFVRRGSTVCWAEDPSQCARP